MGAEFDMWEAAARAFEPKRRKWATPGELARALDPKTVQTPALDLLDRELVNLMDNPEVDRLLVSMPPQEGKSVRTSQRFVEWVLTEDPSTRVAVVSYSDEIARRWGADIKTDVEAFNGWDSEIDLGLTLRSDSRAAGRWIIKGERGGVYCVGVGGSLTGRAVDLLVVDDPIKDLEQAQSSRYRDRAKRFWQGVAVPRLGPGSKCVLIQTRWHEDDLAGWVQRQEPGQWRIVSIPAYAEDGDPLGRAPGEPLQSARGDRDWGRIRRSVGEYVWSALYQQRPAPAEGGLFKRRDLRYWMPLPADETGRYRFDVNGRVTYLDSCWRFQTVDLAASTKTSADYTVVAQWAIDLDANLILLDGYRERVTTDEHWEVVNSMARKWGSDVTYVESRMFGTTLVYEAGRAGTPLQELEADTDKHTRALPASARANRHQLWLPNMEGAPWVQDWVDELVTFPNAVHDDVVDVVAYAARVAAAYWVKGAGFDTPTRDLAETLGWGATEPGAVDLARAQW